MLKDILFMYLLLTHIDSKSLGDEYDASYDETGTIDSINDDHLQSRMGFEAPNNIHESQTMPDIDKESNYMFNSNGAIRTQSIANGKNGLTAAERSVQYNNGDEMITGRKHMKLMKNRFGGINQVNIRDYRIRDNAYVYGAKQSAYHGKVNNSFYDRKNYDLKQVDMIKPSFMKNINEIKPNTGNLDNTPITSIANNSVNLLSLQENVPLVPLHAKCHTSFEEFDRDHKENFMIKKGEGLEHILKNPVEIGRGHFGAVYESPWHINNTNQKLVLKELSLMNPEATIDQIKKEINYMFDLRLKTINPAIACYNTREKVYIFQPRLYANLETKDIIDHFALLDNHEQVAVFVKIAEGIKGLHDYDIIHSDLHPGNIMTTDPYLSEIEIIDMGVAGEVGSDFSDGKSIYQAPWRINLKGPKRFEDDFWSLAITIIHLLEPGLELYPDNSCIFSHFTDICYEMVINKVKNIIDNPKMESILVTVLRMLPSEIEHDDKGRFDNKNLINDIIAELKGSSPKVNTALDNWEIVKGRVKSLSEKMKNAESHRIQVARERLII